MSCILCCVDGKSYSQSACDYAVMISNNMKLPLKILNVIEHSSKSNLLDLSGNIKLGEKDDILEKMTNEEATRSKNIIKEGKDLLLSLKEKALITCEQEIILMQAHGEILDNILELQDEITVLVIGIKSQDNHKIGENVKDIIRELKKPTLLVNNEFKIPKKILIAYNGSEESKKVLISRSINPIFKNVLRDIVNINDDKILSEKLLKEAKDIYAKQNIDVTTSVLSGDAKTEILTYMDEKDCDILAMGAFGHSRIKEFIFGSFTSEIIAQSKKPVLFYR
ncbi:universal stress protein [Arcobacter sp. s6]|uniref:universal stress protein n=1 Tax=Arcobacter sp. s6 TaxID=3230363 RepID=UPI00349FE9EE